MSTAREILAPLVAVLLLGTALVAPASIHAQASAADVATSDAVAALRQRIEAKDYEQAVTEAKHLVELASQHPEAGEDLQVAYMNLAVAQYLAGDYVGSEASYLKVIELVESSGRLTSPRLARAQAGLATTYYAGKRYDLAAAHFDRAVALSRRSEGLFNEAQLPLLEKYADSLTEVGRTSDALKVQRYALRVVERKHGAKSVPYALQLEAVGRWYAQVGAYEASRATLRNAIGIVEDLKGDDAVELIGPLTALADCNRRQLLDPRAPDPASADDQRRQMFHDPLAPVLPALPSNSIATEGQKALERAVAIASSRPETAPSRVADVRTQLGDWYQARQQSDKAMPAYQQAWRSAVGQTLDGKPLTERLFGRPVLLYYLPPDAWDRNARRPADEIALQTVTVELTVTAQGRVSGATVVADGGDPKFAAQVTKAAQAARYRPRFEQGQPVETAGVRLEQPLWILVEKQPETRDTEAPKSDPAPPPAST